MKFADATHINRKSGVAQWWICGSLDPSEILLDDDFRQGESMVRVNPPKPQWIEQDGRFCPGL